MDAVDVKQFLRVSDSLRRGFAAIADAPLTADQRGRWQRRLLAITDRAKRDLGDAETQLARFRDDWNGALPTHALPAPEGGSPGPDGGR